MFNFFRFLLYIVLSIIAFHFIYANLISMAQKNTKEVITDGEVILTSRLLSEDQIDEKNRKMIERELQNHGKMLIDNSNFESENLKQQILKNFNFKQKSTTDTNKGSGLLSNLVKYVSPVHNSSSQVPELENFNDYAPCQIPTNNRLSNNVSPNLVQYHDTNANYHDRSTPLPINEFDCVATANFQSEKTNLNSFFEKNMMNGFDHLSKADLVNPCEWDKAAKIKESQSPLLSLSSMQPDERGFLPSNHYDITNTYSDLL